VIAAEPYENIAFKIPNIEIDHSQEKFTVTWDPIKRNYSIQLSFKHNKLGAAASGSGALPPAAASAAAAVKK
jgi:splicing factor 3A subunit 2